MTETPSVLSARGHRLVAALGGWPRRRVTLGELRKLLDRVDPSSRSDVGRRIVLSDLIAELATGEVIELPSARSYDHSEMPSLPRFVTLSRPTADPSQSRPTVWHPELSWVPQARFSPSQMDTLERVNRWLYDNRDELNVPSRERSLEIFGDEKALDRLVLTSLFGSGRLDFGLLRCKRVVPRLHCEPAGHGDLLLVIENSDTFDSVLSVLRERDDHRVGLVGWGAGTGFEASVLSISRLGHSISAVRYFGDLDENGLRVPMSAATLAHNEGLPAVTPATGLYAALLRRGVPQPGQRKLTPDAAAGLVSWLDPEHRSAAERLLVGGSRMAQEAVGLSCLSRQNGWLESLA
jgi:hypothetical protein